MPKYQSVWRIGAAGQEVEAYSSEQPVAVHAARTVASACTLSSPACLLLCWLAGWRSFTSYHIHRRKAVPMAVPCYLRDGTGLRSTAQLPSNI